MQRIVVKTGSQLLCGWNGQLDEALMRDLVGQMAELRKAGWQVILVSSGAVAAGAGVAGIRISSDPVTRRQVLAALGQVRLMQTYKTLFDLRGLAVAQVLATKSDFQTRNHYLNMRNCLEGMLAAGIVPVVNENDVVSVTELMFTDNDELAGLLASMVNADLLVMLSTVPGVYSGDEVIATWDEASHRTDDIVRSGTSMLGRGGMHSKIEVARKAAALGSEVVIADGRSGGVLLKVAGGEGAGTRFPAGSGSSPAKRWLSSADDHAVASVRINEGAEQALRDKARLTSLLPVGIESLEGDFKRGDVIRIISSTGSVLGCGRAQYDCEEAKAVLGLKGQKPLVHYDYLYLNE